MMNSYEADKFMGEHPEVAVAASIVSIETPWVAFSTEAVEKREYGSTRTEAIALYKYCYYPEQPHTLLENHIEISKAFKDSAKYRKIVETFRGFDKRVKPLASTWIYTDVRDIRKIVGDDLMHSHCNECGQPLEAKKEK